MSEAASNFFGLTDEQSTAETARVAILPVPYEETTSYGKGTANGPAEILKASQQVELFDDELWVESYRLGIQTLSPIQISPQNKQTKQPFLEVKKAVSSLVESGKFPIILGGERSVSLGAVQACVERFPGLSILHIGAHADLHRSYQGNTYSHACSSYHLYKSLSKPNMTQVGIRNISKSEADWMAEEKPNIHIFWARNQNKWNFADIVATLSENVYLTIDVSGLDSGVMPATGRPEPGGISWYQLMNLIKQLCIRKNIVATDIVEFAPIPEFQASSFLVAKLIYKLIGYRFALDLGVTKKY